MIAPPGVPDKGTFTAVWSDDSGDDEIGPGDSFSVTCRQAWLNRTDQDEDVLFNGRADFAGFTDVLDDNDQTERIGFEPYMEDPGGVYLSDFEESFTMSEEGKASIDSVYTISGAFSLVFTWEGEQGLE